MDELARVDELYKAFWLTLPGMLHAEAQALACTLGLAPSRDVPWSAVFRHEITLAAPALLAEAMPGVRGAVVQDALLAHLLAIVDAFGNDRLHDRQIRPTWQLETLLAHARRARDAALARVAPGVDDPALDYPRADEEALAAMDEERRLLARGEPATFAVYLAVSARKQRVGLPASIALAHAAGWGPARRAAVGRLLTSAWMGLQVYDDVMDWEEDWARGAGAWAVALAGGAEVRPPGDAPAPSASSAPSARSEPPSTGPSTPSPLRRFVYRSGVLGEMLARSRRHFREARRRAEALGARRLAAWAEGQEAHAGELARCEAESPGYAARARALSTWARVVLS